MSKTAYYLSAAHIANQYVKSKMTIGASNKMRWDFPRAWACSGSLINTGEMRKYVEREVNKQFEVEPRESDSILEYRIKAQKLNDLINSPK